MDPSYPLVPIVNFFACIIVLVSMSKSLFNSWNIGACSFAIWIMTLSFITGLDSILWANGAENVAPVWCDIVTRIQNGVLPAMSASSFVIIRRLSLMLRHQHDLLTTRERNLNLFIDITLCLGIPLILISLSFVVQTARFMIVEEYGCASASADSGLTVLLYGSAPVLFSVLSLTLYSPRLIRVYCKHKELDELLASNSYLDRRGFTKLLALGLFDILIAFPLSILNIVIAFLAEGGIHTFWPGWRVTHLRISSILTITSANWESTKLMVLMIRLNQWFSLLYAIVFFILYGLTVRNKRWLQNLVRRVTKPISLLRDREPEVSSFIAFPGVVLISTSTRSGVRSTDTGTDE